MLFKHDKFATRRDIFNAINPLYKARSVTARNYRRGNLYDSTYANNLTLVLTRPLIPLLNMYAEN